MIWLLSGVLSIIAVAGVALPWWWPAFAARRGLARRSANVAAYRSRLLELDRDVEAGVVPAEAVEAVKQDLAARLLEDAAGPADAKTRARGGRTPLALGLASASLLIFGGAWYALAGTWRTQQLVELERTAPELARAVALDRMIGELQERVAAQPDDAESWAWLGRSYRSRGNYADAALAFARASALKGQQDPDLLVEEGEAIAFSREQTLAGEPAARFAQALAIAPDHLQALWYSGLAAMQAGDDRAAIAHWERLAQQALPDGLRATLVRSLARLRERTADGAPATTDAAPARIALHIDVRLAPELADDVQPSDTLYVYAVDPAGPPMPVAIERLSAAALPARVTLDDSDSLMPTRKLSGLTRWRVVARLSRSGNATPQPGDLEGSVNLAREDARGRIQLLIDRRRS